MKPAGRAYFLRYLRGGGDPLLLMRPCTPASGVAASPGISQIRRVVNVQPDLPVIPYDELQIRSHPNFQWPATRKIGPLHLIVKNTRILIGTKLD